MERMILTAVAWADLIVSRILWLSRFIRAALAVGFVLRLARTHITKQGGIHHVGKDH